MADKTLNVRVKHRYDTEANWTSKNPVLLAGELAFSKDKNGRYKVGDGTSKWTDLPYAYDSDINNVANKASDFKYKYELSEGQGSSFYTKLFTLTVTQYSNYNYQFAITSRTDGVSYVNVYADSSNSTYIQNCTIQYTHNNSVSDIVINNVKGFLYKDANKNATRLEVWMKVDAWGDIRLFDKTIGDRNGTLTWNTDFKRETGFPASSNSDTITIVNPTPYTISWNNVINKPLTYPPSSHTHSYLPLSGGTLTGNLTVNGGITTSSDIIIPSICFSQDKDSIALGMTADNTIIVPNHKIAISNLLKANGGISTEDISTTNIDITKLTFTGSTAASINFSNRKVSINSAGLNVDNGATFGAAISVSGSITANGSVRFIDYYSESTGDGNTRRAVSSSVIDGLKVGYLKSKTNSSTSKKQFCVMGQWGKEDDFGNATTKGSWTTGYILIDSTSDVRLKKNIKNTDISALPIINQMKVRQFDWKETGVHQQLGLVADELDKFDPLLTVGGGYEADGSMYVKQIDRLLLTEYAIKGIQEQQDEIVELQKENKELKQKISEIDTLKDELVKLKALIMNK